MWGTMTIQSGVKDKILATPSETSKSKYEYEIRYHPGRANVVIDALRRKERVKPRRVRAMAMTIQYGVRGMILAAQSEAFKQENYGMMRTVVMDEAHASRKLTNKVSSWVKEKPKAARDRQNSYADNRLKSYEFTVVRFVYDKSVQPWKGDNRFGKKGKLAPEFLFDELRDRVVNDVVTQLKVLDEFPR
ncbi:hypothetical protein Tco_0116684 [Tanacetum coccineum]